MYLIKAQYKGGKSFILDRTDSKEKVFAMCVSYGFSLGNHWDIWYITAKG